jgi:hypothetical protein
MDSSRFRTEPDKHVSYEMASIYRDKPKERFFPDRGAFGATGQAGAVRAHTQQSVFIDRQYSRTSESVISVDTVAQRGR